MKKIIVSVCLIGSTVCALWLLLFTFINDLAQSPFGESSIIWSLKLFGPMILFVLFCLGYVRARRAMDKEKIRAEKARSAFTK